MSEAVNMAPEPANSKALTRTVAAWVAGLAMDALPPATRQAVRLATLDTVGASLFGMDQQWSTMVRRWAERAAAPAGLGDALASVWGDDRRLAAGDAALVNGVAAHAFELDDYHNAKLHPGAVVVPAALALAEALDSDGERLLVAIAAGYEVMIRTGLALDPSAARLRGWHLTGVCGPLGAAAAAAVLLGLDAERTAWALGLAGTQGAGLFAFNADGSMSKRLHPGFAARAGIVAAELAAEGVTGPTQIYEAEDGGYLAAHSDVTHPEILVEGLGDRFLLDATSFKPYSCCGSLHSYVDAALALRERLGGPPASDKRVRVGMSRVVDVQCGFDYAPGSELNGQMSARYCIAAAFHEGGALPPEFAPDKLADPDIVALAHRIELVPDPALDEIYPANFVGWVEVEQDGGAFDQAYHLDPSGSTANPRREQALRHKFHTLMRDKLSAEAIPAIEAAALAMENMPARRFVAGFRGSS